MRISRHPQFVGQGLWCLAHTLWIGNSFALITSAGLMAHHAFGCWHGDRRLATKYGDAFERVCQAAFAPSMVDIVPCTAGIVPSTPGIGLHT